MIEPVLRSGRAGVCGIDPREMYRSSRQRALQFGAQSGREEPSGLLDQDRHLVTNQSDIAVGIGDESEARAVAATGHETKRVLHLDNDLIAPTTTESPSCAMRESDQARGQTRQTDTQHLDRGPPTLPWGDHRRTRRRLH